MNGFHFLLPLDTASLATLRHALAMWLEKKGVLDPPRADLVLATHEAAANAIEHSGATDSVSVNAFILDGDITIDVCDTGHWKHDQVISEGRGRGLSLVRSLVSDVEILEDVRGTRLRLLQHPS